MNFDTIDTVLCFVVYSSSIVIFVTLSGLRHLVSFSPRENHPSRYSQEIYQESRAKYI